MTAATSACEVLRAATLRPAPWKNQGGETVELAIAPAHATLDEFDWRVSLARVGDRGPFSLFPGVDRSIALLAGAGLALSVDDAEPVTLRPGDPAHEFAGDRPAVATPLGGDVTVLNAMSRRGAWVHRVQGHALRAGERVVLEGAPLVAVPRGGISLVADAPATLASGDALIRRESAAPLLVEAEGDAVLWVVRLERGRP